MRSMDITNLTCHDIPCSVTGPSSGLCCRFLVANDFLATVDTAPLVFPADTLAGAAAGLPPMQQILDVDVSDEEKDGGAPLSATVDGTARGVPPIAVEVLAGKAVQTDGVQASEPEDRAETADKDMDDSAVPLEVAAASEVTIGDVVAPSQAVMQATANPEEILLAE